MYNQSIPIHSTATIASAIQAQTQIVERAIPSTLEMLKNSVLLAEDCFNELQARLAVVALPESKEGQVGSTRRPAASTKLGEDLYTICDRISRLAAAIQSLEKRVQL